MKRLLSLLVLPMLLATGVYLTAGLSVSTVSAHDGEEHTEEVAQTTETESETTETATDAYTFTAQPGDSFTKLARKAVQIYGIESNVNLNQAEIVAAETFLTIESGSPSVSAGETVTIPKDKVKAAADKAEALDKESEQRWEKYVPYVNFDTNTVGEAA